MPDVSRQIAIALDDQSIAKLLNPRTLLSSPQTTGNKRTRTGFSLRYSVPPDTLDSEVSELNMRRTTRGEYVVEKKEDKSDTVAALAGSKLGKPSFRGPAKESRDTECILVYNAKTDQYELQFMDLDIQVVPVLKSRKAPSKSSVVPTTGRPVLAAGSTQSAADIHTVPNSTTNSAAASPIYAPSPAPNRARSVSPLHSAASAALSSVHSGVTPMHASTPLAPGNRSKKTKNLPTRRKVATKLKQPRDTMDLDDNSTLPTLTGTQAGPTIRTINRDSIAQSRLGTPVPVMGQDNSIRSSSSTSSPSTLPSSSYNSLGQSKLSPPLSSTRAFMPNGVVSGTTSLSTATSKAATPSAVSTMAPSAVPSTLPSLVPSPARSPMLTEFTTKPSIASTIPKAAEHMSVAGQQVATPASSTIIPPEPNEDEDFNEFADELADDLMEESDDDDARQPIVPIKNLGTAGGSADDDDSSEEE